MAESTDSQSEHTKMALLRHVTAVLALVVMVMSRHGDGARILMVPMSHSSHINFFSIAGSALKDAGHEVRK